MREVETVQPLAPLPNFRQDIPSYAAINQRQRNYLPRTSDHEIQALDEPTGHVVVTVELDVLAARGA